MIKRSLHEDFFLEFKSEVLKSVVILCILKISEPVIDGFMLGLGKDHQENLALLFF